MSYEFQGQIIERYLRAGGFEPWLSCWVALSLLSLSMTGCSSSLSTTALRVAVGLAFFLNIFLRRSKRGGQVSVLPRCHYCHCCHCCHCCRDLLDDWFHEKSTTNLIKINKGGSLILGSLPAFQPCPSLFFSSTLPHSAHLSPASLSLSQPASHHGPCRYCRYYRPSPTRSSHKVKGIPDHNCCRSRSVSVFSTSQCQQSSESSVCSVGAQIVSLRR